VLVRKVNLENREIRKTVSASGLVKSGNEADLSFVASGKILKINVDENEGVEKGQLLAYLDSSAQSQSVQSYKDARDIKIRQKELFEEEKNTNKNLLGGQDAFDIKLREYEEYLSQAEASYQSQLSLLSNYYIYAPFDGTVVDIYKKEGEIATTGASVIKIADLEDVVFEVTLDQEDYGSVEEGQEAEIELDAYENEVFMGRVKMLPLYADPTVGGFNVKVGFESNGKVIKTGMTGDTYMITEKSDREVLSLIFNEISYDENGDPFIWVIEEKTVKRFPVETGLEGDLYTEIKTDIGERTIVIPATDDIEMEEGFTAKVLN
jgi:membrane fusion protein (multidrug efflux system)